MISAMIGALPSESSVKVEKLNIRAIVILSALAQVLAFNCVLAEPAAKDKVKYKGKVSSDGGKKEAAASSSSKPEGKVFLRVNIESGAAGLNSDIDTYYVDKKDDKVNGMTAVQYGNIVNSPLV